MAFTIPTSGQRIAAPGALDQILLELATAYNERRSIIGLAPTSFPTISGSRIVTTAKQYIDIIRNGLPNMLELNTTLGAMNKFVKADRTLYTGIDDVLDHAGYPAGWDNDFRISNKGIWIQLQDVMHELVHYGCFVGFPWPIDANLSSTTRSPIEGPLYPPTIGWPTPEQAWDQLRDSPQSYNVGGTRMQWSMTDPFAGGLWMAYCSEGGGGRYDLDNMDPLHSFGVYKPGVPTYTAARLNIGPVIYFAIPVDFEVDVGTTFTRQIPASPYAPPDGVLIPESSEWLVTTPARAVTPRFTILTNKPETSPFLNSFVNVSIQQIYAQITGVQFFLKLSVGDGLTYG